MHFLFSPFGSAGDVHPMLGVALALQKRGHDITFIVNGYFQELVQQFGLAFEEMGTKEQFLASANSPDLWNPLKAFRHIYHSLVAPCLRKQYGAFAKHYKPRETVGITNCFGFGALTAQEKLNLPVVSFHIQPAVVWSDIEPPLMPGTLGPRWLKRIQYNIGERFFIDSAVCPTLNSFRHELGLPPVRRITRWWHSPWCVACVFPEWYCRPQSDWPKNVFQTDFPLWDERVGDSLPQEVADFLAAGSPPIVFTPGSSNLFGKKFFEAAVDACRRLDRRGILLTRFSEQIPDLPDNVVHFPFVPFSLLLPRAAAVVHHGGIGSTAQALAAGVPQLIMALAHDQFDNAARIRRLGVGDWLKPTHFSGLVVAKKLRALLSSKHVVAACAGVSAKLSQRNGAELTAAAIDEWANNHRVLVAEGGVR
ncbi:MAG: glycosyltransferase [Pirellulaceae bacterium]